MNSKFLFENTRPIGDERHTSEMDMVLPSQASEHLSNTNLDLLNLSNASQLLKKKDYLTPLDRISKIMKIDILTPNDT